ncbi:MAG: DegT/DnrJ/EryC1/StrS aminotransferase family protein [Planctomycetes bacterium]|nr:DegT/DnrJ/EryC1/StrS aminotransferase family protein [Planctomycetota bacterium]
MLSRKRFDIGWTDLLAGLAAATSRSDGAAAAQRVERWFDAGAGDACACLSVRTGLDLYLEALALPAQSEVLMSALTIPDMVRVVERHGLVAVPVDVDPGTLAPRPEAWRRAAGPRTRAAILAHLFGTRVPLDPLVELRQERGVLVLEDDAQAFTGPGWRGDPAADVSMFSFGPIKTATALQGAVLRVRDPAVRARMRALHAQYPRASQGEFARRVVKYAGLKALTWRPVYTTFVASCGWRGVGVDEVIQKTVRGFPGGDLFQKLRHRPSPALLSLLARRLEHCDGSQAAERAQLGERIASELAGAVLVPGSRAPVRTHWVFAVAVERPDELVARLREAGFDGTRVATMSAVPAPAGRPELEPREARALVARLVYLPLYPGLGAARAARLVDLVRRHAGAVAPSTLGPAATPAG